MELSEEEKKSIELLKNKNTEYYYRFIDVRDAVSTLLNLIDKQQKEIKKEKSRIMELAELLDKQENEIKSLEQELEIQEGCSISKDKIREIINKYINVQGLDNGPLKDMVNELL